MDALFLNDDRHSNNIAVLECDGKYDYCPIFDNGAGLFSNMRTASMDIEPKALIVAQRAHSFGMTFNRQAGAVRALYGKQLYMPMLSRERISLRNWSRCCDTARSETRGSSRTECVLPFCCGKDS